MWAAQAPPPLQKTKKLATKWLLKQNSTCQVRRHIWYNRTSCEDVLSVKGASQLSPSTLHTTQNLKALGLFRGESIEKQVYFVLFLVTVTAEGVAPIESYPHNHSFEIMNW